ncbi:C1q-like domain-containing protein [Aquimarina sp. 2304DJ70-9]|uniref:C1q-like domain-containing protein n=1 Tax=Aquimarina penaris TaxID=3231044 RepID=UPI003462F16E
MEINKKNRTELKSYFKINDKPTQEEFADFIEAGLNQTEDGIAKVQGNPLSVQAEGEAVGTQEVLDIYENLSDDNPQWSINLNPRVNPAEPTSNQSGLNIKDATGQSRLFIKSGDGNVGIGTLEPGSKLTIESKNIPSLLSVVDITNERATIFDVSQQKGDGVLSLRNSSSSTNIQLSGSIEKPSFFLGKLGIGTKDPKTNIQVSGENTELRITNTGQGDATSARLSLENTANSEHWEIGLQQGQDSLMFFSPKNASKKIVMKKEGRLELPSGIIFGRSDTAHINEDGALYRHAGDAFLSTKDNFFIKNVGATEEEVAFHFNTDQGKIGIGSKNPEAPLSITGTGKSSNPDEAMHITSRSILFGGPNAGKSEFSGKITAHDTNALRIIGMSSDQDSSSRKVEIFAEGGLTIKGHMQTTKDYIVAFSASLKDSNIGGDKSVLEFKQINYNIGDHFKNFTHFVAPVRGMYMFIMNVRRNTDTGGRWHLRLNGTGYVNGSSGEEKKERSELTVGSKNHSNSRTVITMLEANDKVHVEQLDTRGDNHSSGFSGMLLKALI